MIVTICSNWTRNLELVDIYVRQKESDHLTLRLWYDVVMIHASDPQTVVASLENLEHLKNE